MNDDELAHYGKLGMKWGKRSASRGSSSKTSSAKKLVAKLANKKLKADNTKLKAANKKLKVANKNTKTNTEQTGPKARMSDADLKSRINRLQMEKTYASLTQKPTNQAKKMVIDVLSTAFKTTATAYVGKMMSSSLAKMTAEKLDPTPDSTPNSSSGPRVTVSTAETSRSNSSNPNYVYTDYRQLT